MEPASAPENVSSPLVMSVGSLAPANHGGDDALHAQADLVFAAADPLAADVADTLFARGSD
jgi:hypothetical protein